MLIAFGFALLILVSLAVLFAVSANSPPESLWRPPESEAQKIVPLEKARLGLSFSSAC